MKSLRFRSLKSGIFLALRDSLSGSVWSSDTNRALRAAQRLETGTVAVNSKKILDFVAPFGGWGQSGIGRELGEEGFRSYLETKTILLP